LPFAAEDYTNWENLIHEYTVGNLKFVKKKTFQQVEIGGLGLFDIGKFLQAQKLRWVISASKNLDAGWKVTLAKCAIVNPFRFDDSTLEKVCPILTSFADTLRAFKVEFFRISNNYKKAKIFGETLMTAGLRSKSFLDIRDLDLIQHEATRNNLLKTTVGDLLSNGLPISRQQLEILWEGTIPTQVYNKIQKIIAAAKVRYNKEMPEQGITLEIFFDTWKKGSKKFRRILTTGNTEFVSHNIVKFSSNMEIVQNGKCSFYANKIWSHGYFTNQCRTFLYKLYNNHLNTNTVLSHFVQGISRNCTFCDLSYNPDPEDESPFHLFFGCPTTERLRQSFYSWLYDDEQFLISRHEFFCCGGNDDKKDEVITAINCLVLFFIWESKLIKTLPTTDMLKKFVTSEIKIMVKTNKKFLMRVRNCMLRHIQQMAN
jgi:hypothetical protein